MLVKVKTAWLTKREKGEIERLGMTILYNPSANDSQSFFYLNGYDLQLMEFFRNNQYTPIISTCDSYWSA